VSGWDSFGSGCERGSVAAGAALGTVDAVRPGCGSCTFIERSSTTGPQGRSEKITGATLRQTKIARVLRGWLPAGTGSSCTLPPAPVGLAADSSASDEFQSATAAEQPTSRQPFNIIAKTGGVVMIRPPWLMHDDVALAGGREPPTFDSQTCRNAAGR
jgi:hypothetical protein